MMLQLGFGPLQLVTSFAVTMSGGCVLWGQGQGRGTGPGVRVGSKNKTQLL